MKLYFLIGFVFFNFLLFRLSKYIKLFLFLKRKNLFLKLLYSNERLLVIPNSKLAYPTSVVFLDKKENLWKN